MHAFCPSVAVEECLHTYYLPQLMDSDPHHLPAPLVFARRSKLQDAVPASPYDEVDETVKEQLGRPLTELFATVDREALASASVAQVHRCTLKDGRKAVVKVPTCCVGEYGVARG